MAVSDRLGGFVFPGYDPLLVPNPPVLTSAGGSTDPTVAFTAPTITGGGAITSYIATATLVSTGATASVTGSASPLSFSGLPTGETEFNVYAVSLYGPSGPSNTITQTLQVQGQTAYTAETTGSFTFVVPTGVTSISAVVIGGGAGADGSNSGGGGGLCWINNVPVTAGQSLEVFQGNSGSRFRTPSGGSDTNGIESWIKDPTGNFILSANGGTKGSPGQGGSKTVGSNYTSLTNGGGVGGNGGSSKGGGGGAGGYSGAGGAGGNQGANNGSAGSGGGAGGGGGANTADGGMGGGTGILGEGSSGAGGAYGNYASPGQGGSGGTAGNASYGNWTATSANYGGGSGAGSGGASRGAVRIIWPGLTRTFPSTNTGDV